MDSTARPRPRPRPRPKPTAAAANGSSETPGASSSSSSSILGGAGLPEMRRVIEVIDTDEMFMRNRNRTYKTWQKLEQLNKEKSKEVSSESDNNDTSPRKNKRKKRDASHVPSWQKSKELTRMLSKGLSDDSDIEFTGQTSTPKAKRKRPCSRSRSITPPPALPLHQIQNAKDVVRKTLKSSTWAAPVIDLDFDADDSTDTIIFQPELSAISKQIKASSHLYSSPAPEQAAVEDHLVIDVHWHPHPLNTQAKQLVWQYKIDRTDSFRDLFEATAEDAQIQTANLIMTYQGKRFFPSVTPQTLKIWAGTAEFDGYEKTAYAYIHKNPTAPQAPATGSSNTNNGVIDIDSDEGGTDANDDHFQPQPQTNHESDTESQPDASSNLKLILRSALTPKDITLTVRPTTKCGAIVKAFLKKAGLADGYPEVFADAPKQPNHGKNSKGAAKKDPRLCIDGDKLDNEAEIGEQDVEDGDMVEVVGL